MLPILMTILSISAAAASPLTLEEATERALAANPGVVATANQAEAARQAASQAKARRFGSIDLVGAYDHYESDRLVRPIASDLLSDPALGFAQLPWDSGQLHGGITVQIPLLDGGRLSEGLRIARLSADAASSTAEFTRTRIRFAVRAAYRNGLVLSHALSAADAYVAALERDVADADLRVKLGSWASVDAEKVHFALAGAKAERRDLRANRRTADAVLAALMGVEPGPGGYALEDIPESPEPPPPGIDPASAQARRADLAAARSRNDAAERQEALAKKKFGPDLVMNGSWLSNRGLTLGRSYPTHEISLALRVPLFDGGERLAGLRRARAESAAAEAELHGKQLEIAQQLEDAAARVDAAQGRFEAGKEQRALGAEVARVEKLKLDEGTGKVEDYLAARAQQVRGETAYWNGLYELQTARDYLSFVTGGGRVP